MKWTVAVCLTIGALLVAALQPVQGKSLDKSVHKKASSAKPTKTPKSVIEQFRGLPAEDVAFLEELDKQFQIHGDKIKFKVERDNTTTATTSSKNSKRTIDGSLSYGYHHNPHHPQHQYYFSKPRYEIYPYSQEDIPPLQHSYPKTNLHTQVEIQQSQGYEIKEVPQNYPANYNQQYVRFPQHQQQQFHQHDTSPVIVLKVPGPSKYAAHLKTLLQQYLEIRAAQVIKELEEQDREQQSHYQHQHQQQQIAVQQPEIHYQHSAPQQQPQQYQIQYVAPSEAPEAVEEDHSYQTYRQQPVNGHTLSTAQTIVEDDEEQHGQIYQQQEEAPVQHQYVQETYEQPSQGHNVYENHQVQYLPTQQPSAAPFIQYQQVYRPQVNAAPIVYVKSESGTDNHQQQYVYASAESQQDPRTHHSSVEAQESKLETNENYPSDKHTHVLFTKNIFKEQRPMIVVTTPTSQHSSDMYQSQVYLPKPSPSEQTHHEVYQPANLQTEHEHQEYQHQVNTPGPFITITQKRKQNRVPFNYHAHGRYSTPPPSKRESSPFTEEQFNKFNKLVNRLKKKQVMLINDRMKSDQ